MRRQADLCDDNASRWRGEQGGRWMDEPATGRSPENVIGIKTDDPREGLEHLAPDRLGMKNCWGGEQAELSIGG